MLKTDSFNNLADLLFKRYDQNLDAQMKQHDLFGIFNEIPTDLKCSKCKGVGWINALSDARGEECVACFGRGIEAIPACEVGL